MYIVAIGWIYVVLMMAITERSVVAGIMTFVMYGVVPLTIILYLTGSQRRRRNRTLMKKQLPDSVADSMNELKAHGAADKADPRFAQKDKPEKAENNGTA